MRWATMEGVSANSGKHRVVIIGSGFGGLFAAKSLSGKDVEVTLVSRTGHHLFQPLLYQVATGILSEGEIAPPTREILARQHNATVLLGEVTDITDEDVMHARDKYSSVASCSSGVELDQAQVVVVGNAKGVGGRYKIGHSVMNDALDADGIWNAIKDAGLDLPERPHTSDLQGRLVNVFLKCEASQDGTVRGRRNAMLDDSDVHWHRQIKSCVGGVTASVTGDPAVFVSVSAAHQGPEGGGPVAAIIDLGENPTGYQHKG